MKYTVVFNGFSPFLMPSKLVEEFNNDVNSVSKARKAYKLEIRTKQRAQLRAVYELQASAVDENYNKYRLYEGQNLEITEMQEVR